MQRLVIVYGFLLNEDELSLIRKKISEISSDYWNQPTKFTNEQHDLLYKFANNMEINETRNRSLQEIISFVLGHIFNIKIHNINFYYHNSKECVIGIGMRTIDPSYCKFFTNIPLPTISDKEILMKILEREPSLFSVTEILPIWDW